MAVYFVDTTTGNDANVGEDNTAIGLATATWTEVTFTLTQAGHGYTFAEADVIRIISGAGAGVGTYQIASSTSDDIVLAETATIPGCLDASDFAAGDLGTGNITSASTSFFATVDKAMNVVAAGDVVYVKGSGNYNEKATIDTLGSTGSPIWFRGYTTTLLDGGIATIHGQGTRSNCIDESTGVGTSWYIFENFRFTGSTSSLFLGNNLRELLFKNCEFVTGGSVGIFANASLTVVNCLFTNNPTSSISAGNNCVVVGSRFINSGQHGVTMQFGSVIDCVFFNVTSDAIHFNGVGGESCVVYGNTIDGNAKNTTIGIKFGTSSAFPRIAINNIIYDCDIGITGVTPAGFLVSRNNLVYNNTDNYTNGYTTYDGEVTSDPLFTDEGSNDYTLSESSPAKKAGFDASVISGDSPGRDIGAQQSIDAGGGGLLMPNKRGGKQ